MPREAEFSSSGDGMLWVVYMTRNCVAEPFGDSLGSWVAHDVGTNLPAFCTRAPPLIHVDFFEVIDEALLVTCDHAHPVHFQR